MNNELNYTAREANKKGFFFRVNGNNCKIMTYKGKDENIVIPAYINGKPVRQIGTRAFADKNIKNIELPYTLRVIRKEAFAKNHIRTIHLPGNISEVENGAFLLCRELREVTIGKYTSQYPVRKVKMTYHAFERTHYIGANAFVILDDMLLRINIDLLSKSNFLEIPSGIREIKAEACSGTNYSIESIGVPASVKRIEDYAFARMYRLKKILIQKDTNPYFTMGMDAFGKFSVRFQENLFIHSIRKNVIKGNHYQLSGWIDFGEICWINNVGYSSFLGNYKIYAPHNDKEAFWNLISIYRLWDKEFTLGISWNGYLKLYDNAKNLYDKIEMAVCILYNTGFLKNEDKLQFLSEHINKAVKYALKNNNKERLMLYKTKKLLTAERGFNLEKALKLVKKYDNEAAVYLRGQITYM